MDENKDGKNPQKGTNVKIYFYLGIVTCALCAVAFGLAFSPLGIYALISSILLGIASLSFCATQKKRNDFKAVFYVKITAYVLLAVEILFFIGGLIYSAVV